MARSKGKSEVEFLRGELRKQKAEIKSLKKQLGHANKTAIRYQQVIDDADNWEEEQPKSKKKQENACTECEEGSLETADIGIMIIVCCDNCGHRTITRK